LTPSTACPAALDCADEQDARRIRAAQIDAIVQFVPLTMGINLLNAGVIVYAFWSTGANVFLAVWGTVIGLLASAGLLSWQRSRRARPTEASSRAVRRVVLHAAALSVVWGMAPVVLFPDASPMGQMIIACLMAGMISGGAYSLSSVPRAGLAYTWILCVACAAALLLAPQRPFAFFAGFLLCYGIFISRYLLAHGNLFVERLRDQVKLQGQSEVIGLLLRDFQEHASDWLWETDADGRLKRVSERFAQAADMPVEQMHGAFLSSVITGTEHGRSREAEDLLNVMVGRQPFRDVVVGVKIGGRQRFWALTAKPVHDHAGTFVGYRGVGADVTDKRQAEQHIVHLARYDTVTGLANRAFFREQVERALADVREGGGAVALLFLDLDQFKTVNDTLGHHVGDALLAHVGERLKACVFGANMVARLGGDEFAVLHVSSEQPAGATALARRIIDAFEAPFRLTHNEVASSTSIGIAVAPFHGDQADTLLRSADLALYRAKANGGGCFRFFEPEMQANAQRRRALHTGLRSALENDELTLVYQPLLDLRSGTVVGCEALVRWTSAEWGAVGPAEFIPIAEESGLIVSIGEWVLRQALLQAARWPDPMIIAVNLSPVQFRNQRLLATVVSALAKSGIPPHRLELEITESTFLDAGEQTLEMLANLRLLGVRISLDDFGTGYSSLSYLRRFPFDKIKIDKSFTQDVATRGDSAAIIRAIVALAEALGMSTLAEGIETEEQLARLRDLGCTEAQGYVFSPPRAPADLSEYLAGRGVVLPAERQSERLALRAAAR
jgi:diguanylate cyclase (GGDEF)-like protein/PAS domain S-box-containing protein